MVPAIQMAANVVESVRVTVKGFRTNRTIQRTLIIVNSHMDFQIFGVWKPFLTLGARYLLVLVNTLDMHVESRDSGVWLIANVAGVSFLGHFRGITARISQYFSYFLLNTCRLPFLQAKLIQMLIFTFLIDFFDLDIFAFVFRWFSWICMQSSSKLRSVHLQPLNGQ